MHLNLKLGNITNVTKKTPINKILCSNIIVKIPLMKSQVELILFVTGPGSSLKFSGVYPRLLFLVVSLPAYPSFQWVEEPFLLLLLFQQSSLLFAGCFLCPFLFPQEVFHLDQVSLL